MDQRLDPFNGKYGKLLAIIELGNKDYVETERSYTKREPLRVVRGGTTGWKWGPQRLRKEARALNFIAQNTDIPVPKVLEHGYDDEGRYYVTMERMTDIVKLSEVGEKCRLPPGSQHVASGWCEACQVLANRNADRFIRTRVIPQLRRFWSAETGFEGFVLPPLRIEETTDQPSWAPKTSPSRKNRLMHGDLAQHNVNVHASTLEVKFIYDWEGCGYFPPQMNLELWRMNRREYGMLLRDEELIKAEVALLAT